MRIKLLLQYGLMASLLFSVVLTTGCGSQKTVVVQDESQARKISKNDEERAFNHFSSANIAEMLGASHQAIAEYEKALKYDPASTIIRTDYARLLFRMHKIDKALEQSLLIEPKNSEVHLIIGDCYRLAENDAEAKKNYHKSVEIDPENMNAYWYLAGYYQQQNDVDSSIWAYYELARLSDTYRIWHELGILLGRNHQYLEARDAFFRSIEINPDKANINSYMGMATTYDAIDSTQLAGEYLDRAAELDPRNVRIFRQKLNMYRLRNNLEKSIEASRQLIALVPSDWEAQRYHGFLLYVDGHFDEADSLYRSRIEFGDDHPLNYFYLGRIANEKGDIEEARTNFTRCVTRDKTFADGWLNLGFTWRQNDSLAQAIDIYNQALEYIVEGDARGRILFALGATLEQNNQFHEAVTTFQDLISLNPNSDQALNYLGYMLADNGQQLQYALDLIERAIEISPNNGAYIDSYAWVHFKLGNYKLALAELEKAALIISNDAVIFEHLGDVHRKLGQDDKAHEQYQKALELNPESLNLEEKMK